MTGHPTCGKILDRSLTDHVLVARSIKHYFLLDQGDFVVQFMDMAEDELKKTMDHILCIAPLSALSVFLPFSQILDRALCRAFKVQRELVSSLQVTHLPTVWDLLLPLA